MIEIRPFQDSDWPAVWPLLSATYAAGDTCSFPPDLPEADPRRLRVDLPGAFRHRQSGFVDALVMFKTLVPAGVVYHPAP